MLKLRALFPAVVSVLLLTACPISDPPIDPYPPYDEAFTYLGTWTGTLTDSVGGAGAMTVDMITQGEDYYNGVLGGSWNADFGGAASGGILRGTYDYARTLNFDLTSSTTPDCIYNVNAMRTEDEVFRGTYVSSGCTPYVTGTLELTKQP